MKGNFIFLNMSDKIQKVTSYIKDQQNINRQQSIKVLKY